MGYMVVCKCFPASEEDSALLVPYTGEEHTTKQEALKVDLEAAEDPEVGDPYRVLV